MQNKNKFGGQKRNRPDDKRDKLTHDNKKDYKDNKFKNKNKNKFDKNKKFGKNQNIPKATSDANEEFKKHFLVDSDEEKKELMIKSQEEKEERLKMMTQLEKEHCHIFAAPGGQDKKSSHLNEIIKKQKEKYSNLSHAKENSNKIKINSLLGKSIYDFLNNRNRNLTCGDKFECILDKKIENFKNLVNTCPNNKKKFELKEHILNKVIDSFKNKKVKNITNEDSKDESDDIFGDVNEDIEVEETKLKSKVSTNDDDIFKFKDIDIITLLSQVKK